MSVSWREGLVVLGVGEMGAGGRAARTGRGDIVFLDGVGLGARDTAARAVVRAARGEGR
jgi:hypothetical protein